MGLDDVCAKNSCQKGALLSVVGAVRIAEPTRAQSLTSLAQLYSHAACTSIASDDSGGRTEFSDFWTMLRSVYHIDSLRKSLRSELNDSVRIIEDEWRTEARAQKQREIAEAAIKAEVKAAKEARTRSQLGRW